MTPENQSSRQLEDNKNLKKEIEKLNKVIELQQKTIDHLTNEGKDPTLSTTSTAAIVSLKNDRGTSYDMYVQVYNELTAAYNRVRDDYSMQQYGKSYKGKIDDHPGNDMLPEVDKR